MTNRDKLADLIKTFFEYEKPEINEFRKALQQFTIDIPKIVESIRRKIEIAELENVNFKKIYLEFDEVCRNSIDPNISKIDIYEMLVQHILTEDIFRVIFSESEFHLHNNIARTLNKLENSLFDRNEKRDLFNSIRYYYEAIKSHSVAINDYREKQSFLNSLYENFYKAYNPKRADKLGIVYTPLEIVDFMIDSTDKILYKFFKKTLASDGVNILDPATGTGTFLTQIMNHFDKNSLIKKYGNELFANEISILPYYIANLNIEYIYQQKTGKYKEFENISFVDTLDLNEHIDKDLFSFSDENLERIKRQESSDFTVIIGNPPYNANQQNENDNNKNRTYEKLDNRIAKTYVATSSAQKTKVYDMYSRFYRWASDRIGKSGIVSFVTNSSFIDSKTFDGFRKTVFNEFNEIYILDLGGNIRKGERDGNVFDIMTGVAISFFVKRETKSPCKIFYLKNPEIGRENKLNWLREHKESFHDLDWNLIVPDDRNNWLNQTDNDWDSLIPIGSKDTKLGQFPTAIFKNYSLGVVTSRDEWVYDFSKDNLKNKVNFHIDEYEKTRQAIKNENIDSFVHTENIIKWTRHLKNQLAKKKEIQFQNEHLYKSLYRPFVKKIMYFDYFLNEMQCQQPKFFPKADSENFMMAVKQGQEYPFFTLGSKIIMDFSFQGSVQTFPFYTYDEVGKTENITDWALEKFRNFYKNNLIEKIDIFNYVYAVLHFPEYRKKYEINLKQDLPRIPFYENFWHFAEIGKSLLDLHINFEKAEKYEINFPENLDHNLFKSKKFIEYFPETAFEYKLGNRSAIEWVIDGYKEKKIGDPTVAKLFDNYKFIDYRDEILDLLKRVTTVSLKTVELIKKLEG